MLYLSTKPLAFNDKTLGDLVECILALAWRHPFCDWCLRRRELVEDMVRATVELVRGLPWVAFDGGSTQWSHDIDELRIGYCRAGWEAPQELPAPQDMSAPEELAALQEITAAEGAGASG